MSRKEAMRRLGRVTQEYQRVGLFMRVVTASRYTRIRVAPWASQSAREMQALATHAGTLFCCTSDKPLLAWAYFRSSERA